MSLASGSGSSVITFSSYFLCRHLELTSLVCRRGVRTASFVRTWISSKSCRSAEYCSESTQVDSAFLISELSFIYRRVKMIFAVLPWVSSLHGSWRPTFHRCAYKVLSVVRNSSLNGDCGGIRKLWPGSLQVASRRRQSVEGKVRWSANKLTLMQLQNGGFICWS